MSLRELYTSVILKHNTAPLNFGELKDADVDVKGHNRACGDEIRVFLKIEGEVVRKVMYITRGCAISQSSASMMSDRIAGKTLDEAMKFMEEFRKAIHAETEFPESRDFEELVSLKGVRKFPNRAHCAMLAWETFKQGVEEFKARRNGSPG